MHNNNQFSEMKKASRFETNQFLEMIITGQLQVGAGRTCVEGPGGPTKRKRSSTLEKT